MLRKALLLLTALSVAFIFLSCGNDKKSFSTDNFKKFVENSKKNGEMSYEKTKKGFKSIFPNIKMR